MNLYAPSKQRSKAIKARFVVTVFIGILTLSLFRAQVLRSEDWVLQSESNRLRSLTEPAPRGIIRDRNGGSWPTTCRAIRSRYCPPIPTR